MQIQINTDNNIDSGDKLTSLIEGEIESSFGAFQDRLTTVDVHLGDESAGRPSDNDMRCMIEVRPRGHQSVAVSHHAETTHEAITGACHKMHSRLETLFGRLDHDRASHTTVRGTTP
ncbi:HPF/RaiA family ribosome-associated protein [Aeromicrobium sp.]|uniref:HPF/RaiA family ribosome-associated protein n=1 Tax=Aeromicrobium sp. TaxID=1871063 RepID=UPI001997B558|nr:HPF/RaiA family ribosome-associated protein [Aeromicrobium sp.]MBC7633590.1 HPF/RaiA family ribosome-associated protein [Aeromicrobium sp.]